MFTVFKPSRCPRVRKGPIELRSDMVCGRLRVQGDELSIVSLAAASGLRCSQGRQAWNARAVCSWWR